MQKISMLSVTFLLLVLTVCAQKKPTEDEIKKLSHDWMNAAMTRDKETLEKIIGPEFKLSGTDLTVPALSRDSWMKNTMENLKIDSIQYIQIKVELVTNIAIVQSRFYWSVSFHGMPSKEDTVNMVDIWIKRKNGWQVVSRVVAD